MLLKDIIFDSQLKSKILDDHKNIKIGTYKDKQYVVKFLKKICVNDGNDLSMPLFENEYNMLKKICHPNIISLCSFDMECMTPYMIFPHYKGGDMFMYITTYGLPKLSNTLNYMKQLVMAIEYLHKNHIIHRDLKLENIVFDSLTNTIKIIDFEYSIHVDDVKKSLDYVCGSPEYMSPEMIKEEYYTHKTDVWSLGILFYVLVFGKFPYGNMRELMYMEILRKLIDIKKLSKRYPNIFIQTILEEMLIVDQEERISSKKLAHLFSEL